MSKYRGYRNIKKYPPPINKWIDIQFIVTGAGVPERQGWITEGYLKECGIWRLKDRVEGLPTHWRELKR